MSADALVNTGRWVRILNGVAKVDSIEATAVLHFTVRPGSYDHDRWQARVLVGGRWVCVGPERDEEDRANVDLTSVLEALLRKCEL